MEVLEDRAGVEASFVAEGVGGVSEVGFAEVLEKGRARRDVSRAFRISIASIPGD